MSDEKFQPILHGERLVLHRLDFNWATVEERDWHHLEETVGAPIPPEIRDRIKFYLDLYCLVAPYYSEANTVLITKVLPALKRWMKASEALLEVLKAQRIDVQSREGFVEFLDPDHIQTLNSILPAELLLFAVQSAVATGDLVKQEIEGAGRNLPIENDLWSAWVCLTTRAFESAGLEISGASLDKGLNESPFVNGIDYLQSFFPQNSRRFNGYESIRIATQLSLRKMGGMKEQSLLQVLMWGLQLPERTGYPGSLHDGSADRIGVFEARLKDVHTGIASRNENFGFDPYSAFPHLRPQSET